MNRVIPEIFSVNPKTHPRYNLKFWYSLIHYTVDTPQNDPKIFYLKFQFLIFDFFLIDFLAKIKFCFGDFCFDENYLNWRFFFLWSADGGCSNIDGMMKVKRTEVKNVDDFFGGGSFLRTRIYSNVRVFSLSILVFVKGLQTEQSWPDNPARWLVRFWEQHHLEILTRAGQAKKSHTI